MDKLTPVEGTLVVELLEENNEEEKTESGIIVPESKSPLKLVKGTILETGPGLKTSGGQKVMSTFRVGDTVIFPSHHRGFDFKLNGKDVLIMPEGDIIARLESNIKSQKETKKTGEKE